MESTRKRASIGRQWKQRGEGTSQACEGIIDMSSGTGRHRECAEAVM